MRWAKHLAHMEDKRNAYKIFAGKREGGDHSEDQGVDRSRIL